MVRTGLRLAFLRVYSVLHAELNEMSHQISSDFDGFDLIYRVHKE